MPLSPRLRLAVPAAVTYANAGCGFAAMAVLATAGLDPATGAIAHPEHLAWAAWLLWAAFLFDMVDGLVAKLMKATSAFGAQLDSLCDAVSFGAAPALLVAVAGGATPLACVAGGAVLFAAIGRLARFNVELDEGPDAHLYFMGLPSPASGMALAGAVLLAQWLPGAHWNTAWLEPALRDQVAHGLTFALPGIALAMAGLMVSDVRYADMPKHVLRRMLPVASVPTLIVASWFTSAEALLPAFFLTYALAGVLGAWRPVTARMPEAEVA